MRTLTLKIMNLRGDTNTPSVVAFITSNNPSENLGINRPEVLELARWLDQWLKETE